MIQASELRIGNYVFDDEGILSKINGMQPYGYSIRCDEEEGCELLIDLYPQDGTIKKGFAVDINLCNPIPLTEEWLIRFGFENKPDIDNGTYHTAVFEKNGISLLFFMGDFNDCQINGDLDIDLSYVHTLQNLWYILTKQELKLKNND